MLKIALLLAFVALEVMPIGAFHFGPLKFLQLGCNGTYEVSQFARVERLCDDCFHLTRDQRALVMCREHCYKNTFFDLCIEALLLEHTKNDLKDMVSMLANKVDPPTQNSQNDVLFH